MALGMSRHARVVVITGATSGIGRAAALRFASPSTVLVLIARDPAALAGVIEECERSGASASAAPADVTDAGALRQIAAETVERHGRLDVWVNDAAVGMFGPFADADLDAFRRVIDVNVMGYVNGTQAALREMLTLGRGTIVNVASIVGEIPQPYTAAYGMSKAAVRALGVSVRAELAVQRQKRIRVSTVLPPTIDTPFFEHAANHSGRRVLAMPPVFPPSLPAKAIVRAARTGEREIVVSGAGRVLVHHHRRHPVSGEAQMALLTEKGQLSPREPAPTTLGTIYESSPGSDRETGGWGGTSRHKIRTALRLGVGAAIAIGLVRKLTSEGKSL
jgi:short-subunit dehydrogenase